MVFLGRLKSVALCLFLLTGVSAIISTDDISETGKTAEELVRILTRSGEITDISGVEIEGMHTQFGTFKGAGMAIGLASGVVLGSGHVTDIDHTNNNTLNSDMIKDRPSNDHHLDSVQPHGIESVNAASLSFTFVPEASIHTISLSYVFGSEEYEYGGQTNYQDAMAIFVNGKNCALVGVNQAVNVNSVSEVQNSELYIHNGDSSHPIEFHGFTTVLECAAEVKSNQENSMKIVVADGHEAGYDAAVFLGEQSFGGLVGYPCMASGPKGMCMRPLESEGEGYSLPHCRVESCEAGYTLDEAGDECCSIVYIQGHRRCDSNAHREMSDGDVQCCEEYTVQSARPTGNQMCQTEG